jgi:exodeoxyribonuclease VII small subunit
MPPPQDLSFEAAFLKLEQTVQALEQGGLTLEQAMAAYEEGMRLAQICGQRLDSARLKITQLENAFLANGPHPEGERPAPPPRSRESRLREDP